MLTLIFLSLAAVGQGQYPYPPAAPYPPAVRVVQPTVIATPVAIRSGGLQSTHFRSGPYPPAEPLPLAPPSSGPYPPAQPVLLAPASSGPYPPALPTLEGGDISPVEDDSPRVAHTTYSLPHIVPGSLEAPALSYPLQPEHLGRVPASYPTQYAREYSTQYPKGPNQFGGIPHPTQSNPLQSYPHQPNKLRSYPHQPQSYRNQLSPLQSYPNQPNPLQSYPSQPESHRNQLSPLQSYPNQPNPLLSYPNQPQSYRNQLSPLQSYPNQPNPLQSYPTQPNPLQAFPNQPNPIQSYPSTPHKSSPISSFPSYPSRPGQSPSSGTPNNIPGSPEPFQSGGEVSPDELEIPRNTQIKLQDKRLQYSHGFSDDEGTAVREQGSLLSTNDGWEYVIAKKGSYEYTSPEGKQVKVNYIADDKGFRVIP